ncbi:MAG: 4-alpha-glucanotransferase [Lachnospiraceae bacterium]|nr:4-alpha-glucanotransferase [Lachnospiraceae bacterium]
MEAKKRSAGILMPVSSLPSPYGIGTFGKEAYRWVDALVAAGQTYWQVLPMGPTSYGDSPYQSLSAFAGNPYFIDLETLLEEGLLNREELSEVDWGSDPGRIDYSLLFQNRFRVLRKAKEASHFKEEENYKNFLEDSKYWLEDYCLYMALKNHFDNREWQEWDEDIRMREPEAVEKYKEQLKDDMEFYAFCQYKFYEQWNRLRSYAKERNIGIVGDIPLYVAMDSADLWAHPKLFILDEKRRPTCVAGVPPDMFSETGQRWGNPLYDWDAMKQDNYSWWYERMRANSKLYDVIRIDHFIGIIRYYKIPAQAATAREGEYVKGPGRELCDVINRAIGDSAIIAEDLGVIVPEVRELLKETGWPGMKVLSFAFDSGPDNEYLPHNYKDANCVVYGGTHDNDTLVNLFENMPEHTRNYLMEYINIHEPEKIADGILRVSYASIAQMVIAQVQDVLCLGGEARMNEPSTLGKNWTWRMEQGAFHEGIIKKLRNLSEVYGRK